MPGFLMFCRPGFEHDAALEWLHLTKAEAGAEVPMKVAAGLAYADRSSLGDWVMPPTADQTVFSRLILHQVELLLGLPAEDRASPLALALKELAATGYLSLDLVAAEASSAQGLSDFCKKFQRPLVKALDRLGVKGDPRGGGPRLVVCFLDYERAYVGVLKGKARAEDRARRLRFPEGAPSRSALKLEEAFLHLLTAEERTRLFAIAGQKAVDLGAAPGGWTFVLAEKGFYVSAVDHGALDPALLQRGMVEHLNEDAFHFKQKAPVSLLVCDMVEKPALVTELIARWFKEKRCRWAVFNLKLPMKRCFAEYQKCADAFWDLSGLDRSQWHWRAKQLYHNREEITVLVLPKDL